MESEAEQARFTVRKNRKAHENGVSRVRQVGDHDDITAPFQNEEPVSFTGGRSHADRPVEVEAGKRINDSKSKLGRRGGQSYAGVRDSLERPRDLRPGASRQKQTWQRPPGELEFSHCRPQNDGL